MTRSLKLILFSVGFLFAAISLALEISPLSLTSFRLRKHLTSQENQQDKSFVFVIPSYNCSDVCERALQSIFSQDYPNFEVIYLDNGSTDFTNEVALEFKEQIKQDPRLKIIRHENRKGAVERLYEQVHRLEDNKIVIYMKGNAWLKNDKVLSELNDLYKKHDIWLTYSGADNIRNKKKQVCRTLLTRGFFSPLLRHQITGRPRFKTFYASLFKAVKMEDFFFRGEFVDDRHDAAYFYPLLEMAGSHAIGMHASFCEFIQKDDLDTDRPSRKASLTCERRIRLAKSYEPLSILPTPLSPEKADLIIFSYNRPMQLWALLESIEKYMKGLESIYVLYRSSSEPFTKAFEEVKTAFPTVQFLQQSDNPFHDFQPITLDILFNKSKSDYILFAVDDMIMKDTVNLPDCLKILEETKAYFFSLRLGKHIEYCYMGDFPEEVPHHLNLLGSFMAWQIDAAQGDWMSAESVDMNIFRKSDLKEPLTTIQFRNPNDLEWLWSQYSKNKRTNRKRIGIAYQASKVVNIPMNLVNPSQNNNMNLFTAEELLKKFQEGWKISIDPLHQVENPSVHFDYIPTFSPRKRD
ncbi:MAG TPA: glycosyltransferase [Chlamydiales bacterium]|nr:glycosyltransferase [Chlamydiales bacterium]